MCAHEDAPCCHGARPPRDGAALARRLDQFRARDNVLMSAALIDVVVLHEHRGRQHEVGARYASAVDARENLTQQLIMGGGKGTVVTPLLAPFGLAYFAAAHVVYKHQRAPAPPTRVGEAPPTAPTAGAAQAPLRLRAAGAVGGRLPAAAAPPD